MAVKKRGITQWKAPIVYSVDPLSGVAPKWVNDGVAAFNSRVGAIVFRKAESGEKAHVSFVASSQGESPIGRGASTPQVINFHKNDTPGGEYATLWHEMGHCVGLGHEQFHSAYELRTVLAELLKGDDLSTREKNTRAGLNGDTYEDLGTFDPGSIMLYPLSSMLDDGRVEVDAGIQGAVVHEDDPLAPQPVSVKVASTTASGAREAPAATSTKTPAGPTTETVMTAEKVPDTEKATTSKDGETAKAPRGRSVSNPQKPVAAEKVVTLLSPRLRVASRFVAKSVTLSDDDVAAIKKLTGIV